MVLEPEDASDILRDAAGENSTAESHRDQVDSFRRRSALLIAILAALLAIASLGGGNATKEVFNNNILASDTFAFYQAKNIRQTDNQLAADTLETLLSLTNPSDSVRAVVQQKIDKYKSNVARYESEPQTGEGKTELLVAAQEYQKKRDEAQRKDPNFDYSQAFLQISIVLGSVAIVAASRPVLLTALCLGSIATILLLNGFLLWFTLPIG